MRKKLFLLAVFSSTAFAQETLEDVVISATRQELEQKLAPPPVNVIRDRELKDLGKGQKLLDLLLFDSSVYLLRSRGRSFFSIRGFDADKVLVLVDGRRLASETDRDFEPFRIGLDRVERVEILKGPASVLYGSDALGGVVNIILKEPLKPELSYSLKYGKYTSSNKPEAFDLSLSAFSGRVGNFNVGAYLRSSTERSFLFPTTRTSLEPKNQVADFGVSLFYYLDESSKSKLRFDLEKQKHESESRISTTVPRTIQRTTGTGKNENHRLNASLSLNLDRGTWRGFVRAYLSNLEADFRQREVNTNRLLRSDDQKFYLWVLEGNLSFDLFESHRLTFGGEFRREGLESTRIGRGKDKGLVDRGALEGPKRKYKVDDDFYALYLQDEWFVSDKLFLTAGIRYDGSKDGDDNLSPRVGLTYSLLPDLRLKANYSQGFRNPPIRNRYIFFQMSNYYVVGNPDLKSEKTQGIDLGIEKDFTHRGGIRANYFYMKAKDLIEVQTACDNRKGTAPASCPILDFPLPPGFFAVTYRNIGKAKFTGFELSGFYKPLSWLRLRTSYTYLEAKDESQDQRLLQRPRHRAVGELALNPLENTKISLTVQHSSDVLYLINNRPQKKDFTLLGLAVNQRVFRRLELFGGVDNLNNKKDYNIGLLGSFYYAGVRGTF